MAPKGARRGVLMTASARRPRASWRDLPDEEDQDDDVDSSDGEVAAKASQLEWEQITREVREEKRKRYAETEFAMGRRDDVAGYDDVAEDAVESERPPEQSGELPAGGVSGGTSARAPMDAAVAATAAPGGPAATAPAEEAAAPEWQRMQQRQEEEAGQTQQPAQPAADVALPEVDRDLPPEGAITAGQQEDSGPKKKRGGKKKTGSQKKRERAQADGEDGDKPWKKRKKDEDEDDGKWLKLKLEGEERAKRIKAARIVSYFDFDSGGALFRNEDALGASSSTGSALAAPAPASGAGAPNSVQEGAQLHVAVGLVVATPSAVPPPPATGNFRSSLRWDLWEDDSEE